MTIFQFATMLEKYSLDVVCLAFVVCVLTSLIKKFITSGNLKKFITFVPFAVGIAVCGVYNIITAGFDKAEFFTFAVQSGLQTGALATVYYIFYEQFMRGKTAADPLKLAVLGLISEYVSEEKLELTAGNIIEVIEKQEKTEEKVIEVLSENARSGVNSMEITVVSKLILTTVSKLTVK